MEFASLLSQQKETETKHKANKLESLQITLTFHIKSSEVSFKALIHNLASLSNMTWNDYDFANLMAAASAMVGVSNSHLLSFTSNV